ncbi:hypothetical protein GQ600_15599 [Phytophthora cactorum]|nr:hypothetical protein GQ600_15599 [Phytophthora cactorum]
MPASWIIFSAHSVGYGLLLASVVVAMGVFGWFLCAWRELLQAGMEREYPLLVRIVSEYTAGFDPEILSARTSEATAAKDSTTSKQEGAVLPTDSFDRMVSVLPSFKPGKCFFCSKNEAEHFVPACGMWGKWTHWRMNQQHNMNNASIASASAVAVSMCTSYYDLQNDRSTLEARVQAEEQKSSALAKKLAACQEREQKLSLESAVQKEANRSAHGRKLQAKKAEVAHSAALQKRLEVSERRVQETSALAQSAEEEATKLRSSLDQSGKDVIEWKTRAEELKKQFCPSALDFSFASTASGGSSLEVSPVAALQTLQPSGRLPYAQSLEIEGLRESSRHSKDDVDYSKRWRLLQTSDLSKSDGTP